MNSGRKLLRKIILHWINFLIRDKNKQSGMIDDSNYHIHFQKQHYNDYNQ